MAGPRLIPIIVGVGDVCNKSLQVADAFEPAELMTRAINAALKDSGIAKHDFTAQLDSISVVPPWTWPYPDLPGLLAQKLGSSPSHKDIGKYHGGNQPALLCDEAARRVATGQARLAVVTGGEALASLAACQKAGKFPPPGWATPDPSSSTISASDSSRLGQSIGGRHSVGLPLHVYPMYENGFRSHEGQTFAENTSESADMYAAFDAIACKQPYSWRSGASPKTASDIGTPTPKNRMICMPYPLLMNAFNTVNLSGACILTSTEHARKLGIPEEKWVYILGGAGTSDSSQFWDRPNYFSSPALTQSIDAALEASGITKNDIDCFDIYSCFPIVPKLACKHLGLSVTRPEKPITVLGGLTSFGGAGNNYSMHAITEMTRLIRKSEVKTGLILANGGMLTYQHALCLSKGARREASPYPSKNPLPEFSKGVIAPPVSEKPQGRAIIETYTVDFDRQGKPNQGFIVGRLESGDRARFVANHGDDSTLARLTDMTREPIGCRGLVKQGEDGRNLFFVDQDGKL
ncbi:thiolase [Microdochium trichocladiopsis]|uniref:Thiolase n=1 Tax=Microdochium trichocladiopsis TaxID=1682393 RepID=A0A9P9BUF4_9PEZI|nr:thiolase [Microdochium trichocladiopsis]KAH7040931.1 thiolase [Microdochium trichocladiopsis]